MSGRPKPGRPAPGSDADLLRRLTREAHEGAQDLRAAIRECGEMMDAVTGDVVQKVTLAMTELMTPRLDAALQAVDDRVEDYLERMERHHGRLSGQSAELAEHLAKVLGASDRTELAEVIVDQAARRLSPQLETIIREAMGHSGVQLREHAMSHLRRGENGRVYVTTDPALAPPGSVVIDGR